MLPLAITTLLFAFLGLTTADNHTSTNPPSSVFTYAQSDGGNGDGNAVFTFALNVDQATSDVYFHMSAPAGNTWMSVGFSPKGNMEDSLMFIAYPSKNGTSVTLSPRTATGHSEPSYYNGVKCERIWADDLQDGNEVTNNGDASAMTVNAVCRNATKWSTGSLDLTSKTQPMIFAVGPAGDTHGRGPSLRSDSLSADLDRHTGYGGFTMDIAQATSSESSTAGVPLPGASGTYALSGATASNAKDDNDPAPRIHGFIMCLTFVVIFPVGALILRSLQRVIMHAVVQAIGLFLVCCATAGGIVISTQYNRSKHFASAHQILGILLLLALLSQLGLGIVHHRLFKQTQHPTMMGKIHRYLGPTVILFGIINAPLGFVLAGNPRLCLPYAIVLLLMVVVYVSVRFGAKICCRGRQRRKQQQQQGGAAGGGAEGYQYPQFSAQGQGQGQGQGHPGPYGQEPPPAYGRQNSFGPGDDVPLRPYASQNSGLNAAPAYPRPMV
ncbi:hypothetical protein LTR53_000273 [Teratosphaeriaceae sp. CCFEE 6253]|nr:hypothetical protein LTR53_000273 [Teratosphaeriaceae sp. CCFEE 6253]